MNRPAVPVRVPARPMENPRMTALNVLQDITRADAYAQLALSTRLRESSLDQRDKDLVTELCYGTLERQITIDYLLEQRLERPDVESVVRDILRMGVYQILYLDRVPDSAAVDESVKLARLMDREPFAGLVNGVLRRIAREKDAGELKLPARGENPALYLSLTHSLPLWIVERLVEAYGFDEAEAIAAYRPRSHPITIRMTPDKMTAVDFEAMMTEKGWSFAKARLPGVYHIIGAGDIGLDKEYQKGLYSVQGEGSILAAMAVAPKRGQTVLDACAAPGGKTAYLAAMMQGTGRVHAWDVHEHRVEMIRGMTRRLRLDSVRPAVRDATQVKEDWIASIDAVLLDAPCSGLGVMLAKPDVKNRRTPETIQPLVQLQKELLDACCQYVKPGGVLVYATCTILPEENSGQVLAFLKEHADFALDPEGLRAALPADIADRIANGMLQLQAHRDGTEGFFIARMRRKQA